MMEKIPYRRSVSTGPVRKATDRSRGGEGLFSLPEDLTDLIGKEILAGWIEEELSALNWDHPLLEDIMRRHPDYHPKELLSVLAFACATGRYRSEEISRACGEDSTWQRLCRGNVPSGRELTTFRRGNRDLLATIVQRVLVRALSLKHGRNPLFIPPEIEREMLDRAFSRLDSAREFDRAEG